MEATFLRGDIQNTFMKENSQDVGTYFRVGINDFHRSVPSTFIPYSSLRFPTELPTYVDLLQYSGVTYPQTYPKPAVNGISN